MPTFLKRHKSKIFNFIYEIIVFIETLSILTHLESVKIMQKYIREFAGLKTKPSIICSEFNMEK